MKRALGFSVYYAGSAWIVYFVIQLASELSGGGFLMIPFVVAAYWWIVAGIGIRLGVRPSEFFGWFGRFGGFVDPETEQPERSPSRETSGPSA